MAAPYVEEVLPPPLDSTSEPPPLFDGTTRLYTNYQCPYAQRVWIVRNYKGLQDEIKLVPINLQNRPSWYKEKVYPGNKVPSLEHNGRIIGESLDLVKYVDANFKGPALLPDFAEEWILEERVCFVQSNKQVLNLITWKQPFMSLMMGLSSLVSSVKFSLKENSIVYSQAMWKYNITLGRPRLAKWIEEINKIDAYKPITILCRGIKSVIWHKVE